MTRTRLIVGLILFVSVMWGISAQAIDADDPAALRAWLENGRDRPEYVDVLLQLLDVAPDLQTLSSDLELFEGGVVLDNDRARLYTEAARVYETANHFADAGRLYARALELDPSAWDTVIRRAAMSIETGETTEAIVLLSRTVQEAPDRITQRRAAILRARAFLLDEQYERAYQHALSLVGDEEHETVEPSAVLLLYEASIALDRAESAERAHTILQQIAPASPERGIIDRNVSFIPTPSRIIPTTMPVVSLAATNEPVSEAEGSPADRVESPADTADTTTVATRRVRGVQVGSFRDPENAEYMRIDIENLGFDATIEEYSIGDVLYHRVLVPIPLDADEETIQSRVLSLKERGIEGMLLFR